MDFKTICMYLLFRINMGWVLSDTAATLQVLRDTEPEVENPEYMVASLEAYMCALTEHDKPVGTISEWTTVLKDALQDAQWQGDDVDEMIRKLKNNKALTYEAPDPLYVGAPVVALLTEDMEWHPAILQQVRYTHFFIGN